MNSSNKSQGTMKDKLLSKKMSPSTSVPKFGSSKESQDRSQSQSTLNSSQDNRPMQSVQQSTKPLAKPLTESLQKDQRSNNQTGNEMALPILGAIGGIFKVGKGIFKGLRAKRKKKKAAKALAKATDLESQSSQIFAKLGLGNLGAQVDLPVDKASVAKQVQEAVFPSDQSDTNRIQSMGSSDYDAESEGARASFANESRGGGMNPVLKWILIGVGSLVGIVLLLKLLVPRRR